MAGAALFLPASVRPTCKFKYTGEMYQFCSVTWPKHGLSTTGRIPDYIGPTWENLMATEEELTRWGAECSLVEIPSYTERQGVRGRPFDSKAPVWHGKGD